MDRFQDKPMCYIPSSKQNIQNKLNEFNLNIEIKQEISDIDFEEEKLGDTTAYDDGYHSKCGEIYINNINKEFSMYCSLCNANFIDFNLFSHHILYGNHETQLYFLNNNCYNTNINQQTSYLFNEKKINFGKSNFQTNNNEITTLSSTLSTSSNFTDFLDIENTKSIRDFRQPIDFKANINAFQKDSSESYKCRICLQKFKSNGDLNFHFQMCHSSNIPDSFQQSLPENKSNQHSLKDIVPIATFSLAVCSTPIKSNASSGRRTRSSSYENHEIGKTRSCTETSYDKSNILLQGHTSAPKASPAYATKSVTPIIVSKSGGSYTASNKYTGSTIKHNTVKDADSIIKASATIAEIAGGVNSDNVSSVSDFALMQGNCPYCPVKFQKMKYLNFHLQKYHPEKIQENETKILETENCYKCISCNMIFRRLDFYKKHMRKHPKNKYKSVVNDISITPKFNIEPHNEDTKKLEINSNEEFTDHKLGDKIEEDGELTVNEELSISNSNLSNIADLNKKTDFVVEHKKTKSRTRKRLKCQYCGKTVLKLNHLILHERKHKMTNSVKCRFCEQRYFIRSAYENHMKRVHPEAEYELTEDEIKQLTYRKDYISDIHNSDGSAVPAKEINKISMTKTKSCSFCPKIFKTVEYRILHEKAHTGEDNFSCKYCEQKYNSIGKLWSHQKNCKKFEDENVEIRETRLRSEAREKEKLDYKNEIEEDKFFTESENVKLRSHFKCTYCKKLFTRKSNWVDHVRKHTGEKFDCNICDYKTTNPFYLKSHMLKIHDYSKATKNIIQETQTGSVATLDTAIEAATKSSLIKSKLLIQSLTKFDSITSQEKKESFERLKLFKCKFCHEVYTKKHELEEHLKIHLKSKQISSYNIYKCKYCRLRYKSKYQVSLHEIKHRKGKLFECNCCERKFENKSILSFHQKIEHDIGSPLKLRSGAKCQFCGNVFDKLKSLRNHINEAHKKSNIKEFICKICKMTFISQKSLDSHRTNEHRQSQDNSEILPESLSLNLSEFGKISQESDKNSEVEGNWTKKEKCKICGIIVDYHYLATHMKTHPIDSKPYKCEICDKAFRFKSSWIRHSLIVHNKNKLSQRIGKNITLGKPNKSLSAVESISLKISSSLINKPKKITIRTLIKEKQIPIVNGPPYQCPYDGCFKSFGGRTGFNKHYLLHLDRFKCKYCNRCFQTIKVLQRHIKFHTEKLPYKCKTCFKAFPVKHGLIWHRRRNNCGNPMAEESNISYNCERCLKKFISKSNLSQHILENTCENSINTNLIATDSIMEASSSFQKTNTLAMHIEKTNNESKNTIPEKVNFENTETIETEVKFNVCESAAIDNGIIESEEYKCKICSKIFDTKLYLCLHTQTRACEVPSDFLCEIISKEYFEMKNNTLKKVNNEGDAAQLQPTQTQKVNLNDHTQTGENFENKKEQYQCEVCLKIFVVKGFLLRHMKYYHPPIIEKVIKTNIDEFNENDFFKTDNQSILVSAEAEENLNKRCTRKRIENDEAKFQCQICLKKFETKGLLAGHTRTKACFKSSSCMSTLRAQKSPAKDGTDETYKCNLCNKLFANEEYLTNHMQNQICILKNDNPTQDIAHNDLNNVDLNLDNQINVSDTQDTQAEVKLIEAKPIHVLGEVKVNSFLESSIDDTNIKKCFTCKKCNKIFPRKVTLAWHTRRKECLYKRQKYNTKTPFGLNQQATKIRKKFIEGIVSSRKVSTERMTLQKKIRKAALQVYKYNKSVAEMATKYKISKTIIYRKVNIFKAMSMSIEDSKETVVENTCNNEIDEKVNEDNKQNLEGFIEGSTTHIEHKTIEDPNKVKPKIDLGVLRNEKDQNMVRAIRNYIRDRKKGRKLPQRFYCDRYQIRKIHFYRKLFKLGLVRKKGPHKRDTEDISPVQIQDTKSDTVSKSETEDKLITQTNSSVIESEPSCSYNVNDHINKPRKGRKPLCSEEIVRNAVMDYRMGKGTQLQMCEKYKIGIWAFHRVKRIIQREMPNLEFPKEGNDSSNMEKDLSILNSNLSSTNNSETDKVKTNDDISENENIIKSQILEEPKRIKINRELKMRKTGDLKKRRLSMMQACGDLIVNRKSKYNIPGTKENVLLMDAISDVVNGVRAFSNAVKHYKISFYTLKRYLRKYKERMTNKKVSTVSQQNKSLGKIATETTSVEQAETGKTYNINEKLSKTGSISHSSSDSLSSASFSSSYSEYEPQKKIDTDIGKSNAYSSVKTFKNLSSNSNPQFKTVFDPVSGKYIIRKKFQGRGGRGKMRQTVYSKPGTKENKILMEAIYEIRNKGRSLGHVARKYQISIQTVSKYIKLFEKQGVISKFYQKDTKKRRPIENPTKMLSNVELNSSATLENPVLAKAKNSENTEKIEPSKSDIIIASDIDTMQNDCSLILKETSVSEENNTSTYEGNVSNSGTCIAEKHINSNTSPQEDITIDAKTIDKTNENSPGGTKQNVLKENSICLPKKGGENARDFIRKSIYITQKTTSGQHIENLSKEQKLSQIEIRKPTYLTQKPSTTVVKISEITQIPNLTPQNFSDSTCSTNLELENSPNLPQNSLISDQNSTHLIEKGPTQKCSSEFITEKCETKLMDQSKETIGDYKQTNQIENEINMTNEMQGKSIVLPEKQVDTKPVDESVKDKRTIQQEQNQILKYRKPIYITQKSISINSQLKNYPEISSQSKQLLIQSNQKPLEQFKQSCSALPTFLSPNSERKNSFEFNKTKLNTTKSKVTSIIKSRGDIINESRELRNQTMTQKLLSTTSNEVEIQADSEDDLIIEHAMRSLLEQDTELDLGNVDSLIVKKDSEIIKSTPSVSNIDLDSSSKSLTAAYKKINDDSADNKSNSYENTSDLKSS